MQIFLESFCVLSPAHASASPREVLFACHSLSSLESAFLHHGVHSFLSNAPTLISVSLTKVRLSPILTLSHVTILRSGQMSLFLFLLAKAALASYVTVDFVALRPPILFQQAQFAQVFPLKPTPFCKLFAGLCSNNKSAIFLSDSCFVCATLSSPPSFLLPQTLLQI